MVCSRNLDLNMQTRIAEPLPSSNHEVTQLLDAWSAGDPDALDQVMPLVIDDLRRLARAFMARQHPGHTLEPTALMHEAYLRLVGRRPQTWASRAQFFAYIATTMRRLLVNHARDGKTARRGGEVVQVSFDEAVEQPRGVDLLDLDEALRGLAEVDSRQCRIVELRYFGGLSVEETAQILGISARTVKREWHTARLWLLRSLNPR